MKLSQSLEKRRREIDAAIKTDVAEYAIIDAALARLAADDLVTKGAAIIDAALARLAADDLATEASTVGATS